MAAPAREIASPPPFAMTPLSPVGGVEIRGIDLAAPFGGEVFGAIMDAFLEHHILVFRDQNLSKEAQLAFTRRFGEIEEHVGRLPNGEKYPLLHVIHNLDEDGNPVRISGGNYFWHTDKSYHAVPSLLTMLHAVETPRQGGDTQFANMHMAWDSLDRETQAEVSDLCAIHSWEANRRNTRQSPATEVQKRERPPVRHPVVRSHPVTGRKALYLGIHTSHIEGRPRGGGPRLPQPAAAPGDEGGLHLHAPMAQGRPRALGQSLPAAPRGRQFRHGERAPRAAPHGREGHGSLLIRFRRPVRVDSLPRHIQPEAGPRHRGQVLLPPLGALRRVAPRPEPSPPRQRPGGP